MRSRHRQTLERLKISEDDIEADLKVLSANIAPQHISAVQKERAELRAMIEARDAEKAVKKQPVKGEIQTQWSSDSGAQASSSTSEAKIKIKTRSETPADISTLTLEDLTLSHQEQPAPITVAVGKRSLEVLQCL